ncbi:DedA family protein [Thalassiella azotivora]
MNRAPLLPRSVSGAGSADGQGLGGLAGWVADVIDSLGEVGVGLLTLLETVFPPVPSEIVLPLAGYLAQRGRMEPGWVLVAATLGSLVGAWLLYWLGHAVGPERSRRVVAAVPLMDAEAVDTAVAWFHRHGPTAVLVGRLVPGVRSLVSLPAGSERMPFVRFTLLTALGSAAWNGLLVGAGMLLGTQYRLVEEYSWVLDVLLVGGLLVLVVLGVRRRLRQRSAR